MHRLDNSSFSGRVIPAKAIGLAIFIALGSVAQAVGQEVEVYVSSKVGDRMTRRPPLSFCSARRPGESDFRIDEGVVHQKMIGFGASFLETGMICLNSLDPAEQESVLRAVFDPNDGAGFSAMKTVIAATDFMSAGPWYSYDDTPGDVELKHFSIQRDLGPNGLITFIKRARKYGRFVLQAPMDYPPDWMLFDVNKNQDVDPQYFPVLARYYLRYLQEYEKNDVFVDYLSLFNEPGEYTKIPYWKIRDLIKNDVGPLLKKDGIKTKIQLSEAPFRGNASGLDAQWNYPTVLDDPEARKYVDAIAYHGYDWKNFDKIAELHSRYPDLPLWMTEICWADEAGAPKTIPLPRYDFEDGDYWGNQIMSDLEVGASAWIYWGVFVDQKGGPWLVSTIHRDPVYNPDQPVVIIDRDKKKVSYTGLYYYMAHFSRFVRPGFVRIGTSGKEQGIRCMAFRGPDGKLVTELINSRNENAQITAEWRGKSLSLTLPAISITTCVWESSN